MGHHHHDHGEVRNREARAVLVVSFIINLALAVAKLLAGVFSNSAAIMADALHTMSDTATDVIVWLGIKIASRPADRSHTYGHGKFESLASSMVAMALMVVGGKILVDGAGALGAHFRGERLPVPGWPAAAAAAASIVLKEALYQYTAAVGRRIDSRAMMANAWHHRSDMLSSVGSLLGIIGAMLLGPDWRILDPIAAIGISLIIIKMAWSMTRTSVGDLLDESLEEHLVSDIRDRVDRVEGVLEHHGLKTRRIGSRVAIDVHILVDPDLSIVGAHDIATEVERSLKELMGRDTFVSVHMEPTGGHGCDTPLPSVADHDPGHVHGDHRHG